MRFRNLVEVLYHQRDRLGDRPAVRYPKHGLYHDVSWNSYTAQVEACATALIDVGVRPGERIGLLSENRVEWIVADMAIMAAGAVNVPPHAPLTAAQVRFQLLEANVRWLFISGETQLHKIREVRSELPELKGVIVFDRCQLQDGEIPWSGLLHRGRRKSSALGNELQQRARNLNSDSLATIMYTSGTTGVPKGVMLTHGNLLSNADGMNEASPRSLNDVLLAWLPLSHIYARTVDHYLSLLVAMPLCLAESPETVVENLADIHPTHMAAVPRFYEKVLAAVQSSDGKQTAARLRKVFGPRVDWLSSGGAPLPPAVARAYHDAGVLVLQGYGLTESSPVISFNRKECYKLETVGQAIPGVEIKIADDGEILTRGPHVMKGYWKNPEATAEAIREGWLYTGDLGELDDEGFLTITGRKKDLLVLSNGKKVVPNHIEGLLLSDPCIDQAVVYGEGRNFLTALIVPHWDKMKMNQCHADIDSNATVIDNASVNAFMEKRVQTALRDVSPAEQVKRFVVLAMPFSVERGELTVSMKLRRNVIFEKYKSELEKLYLSN